MKIAEEVRSEIEKFLSRHGMRATVFGLRAVGDPHVVKRLRRGKGLHSDTIDAVRKFMVDYEGKGKSNRRRQTERVAA